MQQEINITRTPNSKLKDIDFDNIPLGRAFTDHMFVCEYEQGSWINPRIEPLALIPTHPAAMALHYGQAIFEGMKATIGKENTPLLFRPEQNAKRFNASAARLGMPLVPEDLFVEAVKKIVGVEYAWIPPQEGSALYLRPFMYANEAFIGMRAATSYKFVVICSPAGPFFTKKIKLYAETEYIRAADGGTGEAKAAGNYAAAILPDELITFSKEGTLEEAFGTGTAVGIAMIGAIGYNDEVISLSDTNPVSKDVKNTLNEIKAQKRTDKFDWIVPVAIEKSLD